MNGDSNSKTREELELKKLALEVEEMETHWWRKPRYLSILIPAILTLTVLTVGIITDYIDFKGKKLGYASKTKKLESSFQHLQDSLAKTQARFDNYAEFNRRVKLVRYLRDVTVVEYSKMRTTDDLTEALIFLQEEFENHLPTILYVENNHPIYVPSNPNWLKLTEIFREWAPEESNTASRRHNAQLDEIFYDLNKEVTEILEPSK